MLEVSHSSLERADHPTSVTPADVGAKNNLLSDLLPLNPSAKAIAPLSPKFMLSSTISCREQLPGWRRGGIDLIPAAVIDRLSDKLTVLRLLQFDMPSTKARNPRSSMLLFGKEIHFKLGACHLLSVFPVRRSHPCQYYFVPDTNLLVVADYSAL
mmetsp:Transcript_37533/g.76735  ORF Transcript_37533/g.76735 Transcript_37533/m.76735 type:complete len:155 (-) Transcript_37533:278-742(-)